MAHEIIHIFDGTHNWLHTDKSCDKANYVMSANGKGKPTSCGNLDNCRQDQQAKNEYSECNKDKLRRFIEEHRKKDCLKRKSMELGIIFFSINDSSV